MDWALVKKTLEDQIRPLVPPPANSPAYEPRWQHGSSRNVFADPATGWKTVLRIVSVSSLSNARRYSVNAVNPALLDENIASMKRMIVEFKVEADYFDDDASRWAVMVAEEVKSKLYLSSVRSAFLSAEMALSEVGDTIDASFPNDNRTVNTALFEMTFMVADCVTNPDVEWFDHIDLTSCIFDEAGALLSSPPNYTDKRIPENS
tara:strand:- start:2560 stop:3174 length:615 start_codon:yes stop_codon:yes gene_type:complete